MPTPPHPERSLFFTAGTTGQVKSAQQQLHAFERNLQKNQGDGEGGEADAERLNRQEYDNEVKLKAQEIRRDWKLQRRDVSKPNPRLSAKWLHPIHPIVRVSHPPTLTRGSDHLLLLPNLP